MITHVVTFRMRDRAPTHLERCKEMLGGLVGVVPTLRSMLVGVNVVVSPRAHDLALIATFDDLDGLRAYQVHPAHERVATYLRDNAEVVASVDFEG